MREPFAGGMTWERFCAETDARIRECYLAEHDEHLRLVPYRKRQARRAGRKGGPTGDPDRAGQELPSAEELQIPEEVWESGVNMAYTLLFWQAWRARGAATEHILERWYAWLNEHPPRSYRSREKVD